MTDLLIIDYETTGVSIRNGAEGIQVGAIRLDGESLDELGSFASYIRPENPHLASPQAMAIHQISLSTLAKAPRTAMVMKGLESKLITAPQFTNRKAGYNLVAHNARFDQKFHQLALERAGLTPGRHGAGIHCSIKYFRKLVNHSRLPFGQGGMGLDALAYDLGLNGRGAHDALEDVRIVAAVLRLAKASLGPEWPWAVSIWPECMIENTNIGIARAPRLG